MAYTDNDFGFTAVDETELNILLPQSQPVATPPAVSSDAVSAIQSKLVEMDGKLNSSVAMRDECKSKLLEVEGLILPLLNNLMANPQKEYIHWANRTERLSAQIDRITRVTRSYGV